MSIKKGSVQEPPYASKQSFSSTPPSGDTPQRPDVIASEAWQSRVNEGLLVILILISDHVAASYFRRSPLATLPSFASLRYAKLARDRSSKSGNVEWWRILPSAAKKGMYTETGIGLNKKS